ncbi:MAG: glycosyltransferase, partial [Calditrichaceae bacterium]|nr:glycosyltransferase [Calditrichaceae bacterium]
MKIILVGPYPPPFGGVSIHCKRLHTYLNKKNLIHKMLDVAKIQIKKADDIKQMSEIHMIMQLIVFEKKSIVHIHIFSIKLLFFIYLISFKHKVLITLHNERFLDSLIQKNKISLYFLTIMFSNLYTVIVMNLKCKKLAELIVEPSKIDVISGFIPPEIVPPLTDGEILSKRRLHKFMIASNAWKIRFYKDEDLYGIDLLIELMNHLVNQKNIDAVLIFLLPEIGENNYYNTLLEKISYYNLNQKFLFITKPMEIGSSLWKISDLVIRATNTDGSSISILEALDVGTPVLASNCVERPEGVS